MIDTCRSHLAALVSMDTQNPPRAIDADHGIIRYTHAALIRAGFTVEIDDLGDGSVRIDAVRGTPSFVINCHLDTVPVSSGWSTDPFALTQVDDVLSGLGSCDVKGAAACLLTAAEHSSAPARILFTTDEEAGKSRCIRSWTTTPRPEIQCAIVCEPTNCRAVLAHRGLLSATARFTSTSAHSSRADISSSATHNLVEWAAAALVQPTLVSDNRFNIGRIEGGTKPNMIADDALVRFGLRFSPDHDPDDLLAAIKALAPKHASVDWQTTFLAPALVASSIARSLVNQLELPAADPVDFWTEAALFAQAGIPAFVLGPGDISRAHAPNESVPISQLEQACSTYINVLQHAHKSQETIHAAP